MSRPAPPAAFSYHAKRAARPEGVPQGRVATTVSEASPSKTPGRSRQALVLGGLVIVLLVVLWSLSVSTAANIHIIQPSGFSYLPHSISDYRSAAAKAISSSFYNRFKPTLSSEDITQQLERDFPEINHAAVTIPVIGNTPTVYIQLTKPELIYTNQSGSYLVDSSGVTLASTAIVQAASLAGLPLVSASGTSSLKDGDQVLTSSDVVFIQTLKAALAAKSVSIGKMVLVPMAEELDVYPAGVGYYVIFNLHETDALQQVGTYLATVATLKQSNQTPSQYIDVTVDGRAYYK